MIDVERTIISQYSGSPTLRRLITDMNGYLDPRANFAAFFNTIWNVNTAVGYGLDVWGRIVGVGRLLQLPSTDQVLGFDNDDVPENWYPFNQGIFFPGNHGSNAYQLPDDAYRVLVLTKALANIVITSAPAINQLLRNLFPGRGKAYVIDLGDMAMRFVFEFELTPTEYAILTQSGALPHPAGVGYAVVVIPNETIGVWGFVEGEVYKPFDFGIFYLPAGSGPPPPPVDVLRTFIVARSGSSGRVAYTEENPPAAFTLGIADDTIDWFSTAYGSLSKSAVTVGYPSGGGGTATALRTLNGIGWVPITMPATRQWRAVAYSATIGGGGYVAVINDTGVDNAHRAASSPTGETFTLEVTPSASPWAFIAVIAADAWDMFIAASSSNTTNSIALRDGAGGWSEGGTGSGASLIDLDFDDIEEEAIAIRSNGDSFKCVDVGVTWGLRTAATTGLASGCSSIAGNNGVWGVVGSSLGTTIYRSTDNGENFTSHAVLPFTVETIRFRPDLGAGLFVAVGDNGVCTSPDLLTWTTVTVPVTAGWRDVSSGIFAT